jgi:DNA polymerase-1
MFVGQAPGKDEDRDGRCFIGPAGQLLTQAIRLYKLQPAYVTNAVKCFPQDHKHKDRDPNKEELAACRPYLDAEIAAAKPKMLVALGNIALKALVGKTGISTWSGRVVGEAQGVPVFALLHPSYILRYPRNKATFESHCRELGYLLRPETKPKGPPVFEVGPKECRGLLRMFQGPVTWDLETTGKFKSEGGRIRTSSWSDGKQAIWLNVEKWGIRAHEVIKEFLESPVAKGAHNCAFETRWAIDEYGVEPVNLHYDTMVMHRQVDENSSHRLNDVAAQLRGTPDWDVWPVMKERGWDYETVPIDRIASYVGDDGPVPAFPGAGAYGGIDSWETAHLIEPLKKLYNPLMANHYKTIALPMAKMTARMEVRGIKIDVPYCEKIDAEYQEKMDTLATALMAQPPVKKLVEKLESEKKELNFNSDTQMRRLFFDIMKFKTDVKTDTGQNSVAEASIKTLADKSVVVKNYLEWKGMKTLKNNFLQKFPTFADEHGIVRPSMNSAFVVTDRLSVTKPPFQAMPEDPLVRGMVISRFDGGSVISADYKQLEVRLVASESEDKTLIGAITTGQNLHELTARLMFKEKYLGKEKTHRLYSIAKRINFAIVYGVTAYALAAEFGMTEQEAEAMLASYERAYPNVFKWIRKQHATVDKYGFMVNRFGLHRRFPEIKNLLRDRVEWKIDAIHREAANFMIASQGADINNLATIHVDRELRRLGMKTMLVLPVHDSILLDAPAAEAKAAAQICVDQMSTLMMARCPWLLVKLEIDVSITKRWGEAS